MKRLTLAASAILLAVTLTGCTTAPEALTDAEFYDMATSLEFFSTYAETSLDDVAAGVCSEMSGNDAETAWLLTIKALTDAGVPAKDAGSFTAFATAARCPDMMGRLPDA